MVTITNVRPADLAAVVAIERTGFSPAEAGSPAAFRERIKKLADTFLVARENNQVVGFAVGLAADVPFVQDEMYEKVTKNLPVGGHLLILSIAVAPAFRGRGIGSQLLVGLEKNAQKAHREAIALDSLAKNIPFYLKNGFQKVGVSASSHAGETWYNLVKNL